jgi:hypothetical protein
VTSFARLAGDLSEIALQAASREHFRQVALGRVCRSLAIDAAAINHAVSPQEISIDSVGLDAAPLRRRILAFMNEFSVAGIRREAVTATRMA